MGNPAGKNDRTPNEWKVKLAKKEYKPFVGKCRLLPGVPAATDSHLEAFQVSLYSVLKAPVVCLKYVLGVNHLSEIFLKRFFTDVERLAA